jgi:Holliday junction DNA helicase RuvA
MIARLKGLLEEKNPGSVVVMAGGVGYGVHIPLSTFYELPDDGAEVDLHIQTVVRDDALDLFGFLTRGEREAFNILCTVSKIGPRLALNILSGIRPRELASAVSSKNLARLSSVPGVGAKTAERLVVELKDKVAKLAALAGPAAQLEEASPEALNQDLVSALLNLGYSRPEAEKAAHIAQTEAGDGADLSALLRLSLKKLRKA